MPSVSLPVLAIKEANEHLQALFLENQKQETQIHELSAALKQAQEENGRLSDYVRSVNDHVLKLGQEHIENLNALRESLNAENQRRLTELQKSHERKNTEREQKARLEEEKLHKIWKKDESIRISDIEEQLKAAEAERISQLEKMHTKELSRLEERLKNDHKSRITDLQVKLKSEEKKKLNQLQQTIDEQQVKVVTLENKIQKLNNHALNNSKRREEHITMLNNMFKSTMENMSVCLNITGEEGFVGIDHNHDAGTIRLTRNDLPYSSELGSIMSDSGFGNSPSSGLSGDDDYKKNSYALLNGVLNDTPI